MTLASRPRASPSPFSLVTTALPNLTIIRSHSFRSSRCLHLALEEVDREEERREGVEEREEERRVGEEERDGVMRRGVISC